MGDLGLKTRKVPMYDKERNEWYVGEEIDIENCTLYFVYYAEDGTFFISRKERDLYNERFCKGEN